MSKDDIISDSFPIPASLIVFFYPNVSLLQEKRLQTSPKQGLSKMHDRKEDSEHLRCLMQRGKGKQVRATLFS